MPSLGRSAKVFLPAKMVFVDVGVLLLAAKDVAASQGILVDIFRRKIVQKVAGRTDLEDGLRELEELINKVVAMSSVQLVNVTHKIDNKVAGIDDGVRGVDVKVQVVNDNVKAVGDRVQTIADGAQGLISDPPASSPVLSSRRQGNRDGSEINPPTNGGRRGQPEAESITDSLRTWQSPPDPFTNHNIAGDRQHEGTAEWIFESNQFESWKVAAGSGKAVLCSAIIDDLMTLKPAATFFRHSSNSLLVPTPFATLSRFYKIHDNGARRHASSHLHRLLPLASSSSAKPVQHFIQLGGDVNARDEKQRAPLHLASQALSSSSGDIVQTLIMDGADVNARDERQSSPFAPGVVIAIGVVEWCRADIDPERGRMSTQGMGVALSSSKDDAVRTLILNGADVSARGEGRRTPLHLASSSPNDVVQTLILNGADVNAQDGSHLTPCIWRRCR
ncbi:ankyrin repeat-containing domain protein [Lactarius deliciosus]|nr:ankyrin repeat-containing domain protein [Lactarius deliciosus]